MSKEQEQLLQWIDESDNIVFLAVPVSQQKVKFRILEVLMDYINRTTIIHRKRFCPIVFISVTRKNFTVFTGIKCCFLTPILMPLTLLLPIWKSRAN